MADALHAADVARALGISCDLFLRTRTQLEQRGFPKPLPLVSRATRGRPPLRWCAELVEAWKRGDLQPAGAITLQQPKIRGAERQKIEARLG